MAIDPNYVSAVYSGARQTEEPEQEFFSLSDTIAAPFRGIEGGIKSLYNFTDYVLGDILPDYDTRLLGTSNTTAGAFIEGAAQFATGFVPVVGQLGKVGRLANARKFLGPDVANKLARGGKLTWAESKILAKNTKLRRAGDNLAAGVAADFLMFDAQEERLSNLLYQYPALQNPVTEYLQASEDDGEIEGRFKNVIEGLFMEAGMAAITKPFMSSVKMIKNRNKKLSEGKSPEDAVDEAIAEGDPDSVNFNYADINDPVTGIRGQDTRDFSAEEIEDYIAQKDLTLDDFIIDPATGRVDFATAGAGGTKATPQDIAAYYELRRNSDVPGFKQFIDESEDIDVNGRGLMLPASKSTSKFLDNVINHYSAKETDLDDLTKGHFELLKFYRSKFGDVLEDVKIGLTDGPKEKLGQDESRRAYYNLRSNNIRLDEHDSLGTLVHEMTHGLSVKLIDKHLGHARQFIGEDYLKSLRLIADGQLGENVPTSFRELTDLYLTAVDRLGQTKNITTRPDPAITKQLKDAGETTRVIDEGFNVPDVVVAKGSNYGLGNLQEFVAQALMDPQFQRELASISITKGKKKVSMLKRLRETIAKMLGFSPQQSSLLDEVISVSNSVFKDQQLMLKGNPELEKIRPSRKYTPIDPYDEISEIEAITLGGYPLEIKGYKFLEENAKKYKLRLSASEKKAFEAVKQTKLYNGAQMGKVSEEWNRTGNPFGVKDQLDNVFRRLVSAARKSREESVTAAIPKYDPKVSLDGFETKHSTVKGAYIDSHKIDIVDSEGNVVYSDKISKIYKGQPLTKQQAIGSAQESFRKQRFQQEINNITSGDSLINAAKSNDISVDLDRIPESDDAPLHMEVTFVDNKTGKQLGFRDVPEEVKTETERYLRMNGGKVKAPEGGEDVPIGKTKGPDGEDVEPEIKTTQEAVDRENELTALVRRALKDAKPGGGPAAIRSIIRTISEEKDFITIARAIAEEHAEFFKGADGKMDKAVAEELLNPKGSLEKITAELNNAFGGNQKNIDRYLKDIEKNAAKAEEVYLQQLKDQQALRFINNMLGEDIYRLAKESTDLLNKINKEGDMNLVDLYDQKYAQMLQQMELMVTTQRLWGLYGRIPSLLMLQRKFIFKEIKSKRFESSLSDLEGQSMEAIKGYKEAKRGSMGQEKLLQLILASRTTDDIQNGLNAIVKETMGKRMFDVVREYWINSLLSGITTQQINFLGSLLTYGLKTLERAAGAALTGNFELAKQTVRYAFNVNAIVDSFDLAARAWKSGEAISIPNARQFDDSKGSMDAITSDRNDAFGSAINMIGTIIRLPSRGLLTGDELFKAMTYRTYVMTELAMKGKERGLAGKELAEYVQKGVKAHITETGRVFNEKNLMMTAKELANEKGLRFAEREKFINNYIAKEKKNKTFKTQDGTELDYEGRGALAARAEENAKITTHTQDPDSSIVSGLSNMVGQNPFLTAVIPFVRTPYNILKFGVERSPLGLPMHFTKLMTKKYRKILAEGTATEKAELAGKLSMSVATTSSLVYLLASQDLGKYITGYGPRNERERKTWELNNQPYSIKIGDKVYSYQRLDPIATMLGIVADINEALSYNEFDEKDLETAFGVVALAFSNNVTNKSYVQGIDNLFKVLKDPVKNAERFAGGIAGGLVPNFLNQTMNFQEDRPLREVRGVIDYMRKRIPGVEGKLPPRYNFLGEVETLDSTGGLGGFANPIYTKKVNQNIVDHEFGNIGAGFGPPSHMLAPGVEELNMKDYYNPETGQQAYARMMELVGTSEIQGKTLRQRLTKLFQDKRYQDLPDADIKDISGAESPKVKIIRRLLSAYNSVAKQQMLSENPELLQRYRAALAARTQ